MTVPVLFAGTVIGLTALNFDFLHSLGWDPFLAPTFDWPSGLALGQLGWVMTLVFVLSGLGWGCFVNLALNSVHRLSGVSRLLLSMVGIAMCGLAFTTDPTIRSTPATIHGMLHDFSFVVLGLALLPGMIFLALSFRKDLRWQGVSTYTFYTTALALPAYFIKGLAFYVFLLSFLIWQEVIAIQTWKQIKP